VDVHLFRSLLHRANTTTDPTQRDRLLRQALTLWRGPALLNAATDQLRNRLCADLDELHQYAVEESLAVRLDLGHHQDLLPDLTRTSTEHPNRESLVDLHMRALYQSRRTADALDVYRKTRTRLANDLGPDPSPALLHLHQAILRDEPLPAITASA
jgi:DNA-binding SARP family transcriptional activator